VLPIQKYKSIKGFTIMEVALAATVLALTLTGMIGVIESGNQMLDLSRKQTMATQILHSEMETLRLQSWQVLSGYNSSGPVSGAGYPSGPTALTNLNDPTLAVFVASYPQAANIFTLTRTVFCTQPSQSNNNPSGNYGATPLLLQVTFRISWTGLSGQTYTRTSTTSVGANGLSVAYQRS
jgi:Tfp pilus assembly protein PilV